MRERKKAELLKTLRGALVVHSAVRGGAEKYLAELYGQPGFSGRLFGSMPDWPSQADLQLGPKWSGGRTVIEGKLRLPGERRRLLQALEPSEFDFAHMQFKREQIGFTKPLSRRMPVVWTEHGVMAPKMRTLIGRDYAKAADSAALVICVSEEVAERVAEMNPRAKVEVIENAVDTTKHTVPSADERRAAREALGIPDDRKLAIWVGRMDEHKRPGLAAEIGRGWDGDLLIAGDGALRSTIVDADGVRAVGHVDPGPLYAAADVVLMTSDGVGEGLPYVMLEAAAHGLPVVVSREVPLFARVASESGGVAVADDGPGSWHDGLNTAVAEPDRRDTARSWALDHDLTVWERRHHEAIERVL